MTNYDYWDERNYLSTCHKCGNFISSTRYCSRECWIEQREKCKPKVNISEYISEYNVLQIIPPKSIVEIKKQYYKLCLKYHPDKGGDSDVFIKINDAYTTLTKLALLN